MTARARRLRSAPDARRPAVPAGAIARRAAARVRYTRSTPTASCASSSAGSRSRPPVLDAQVVPFEKTDGDRRDRRAHRRRAVVADRRDRPGRAKRSSSRWSWPTSSAARWTSTPTCSPATASRCCSRSRTRDGQFSNYGAMLGAAITVDGREPAGVPLDRSRHRQSRLLRRERPLAEAVLPQVAAQVRAARHLALLDAALPSGRQGLPRASRRGLRRADRILGRRRRARRRRLGAATAAPAATRCS